MGSFGSCTDPQYTTRESCLAAAAQQDAAELEAVTSIPRSPSLPLPPSPPHLRLWRPPLLPPAPALVSQLQPPSPLRSMPSPPPSPPQQAASGNGTLPLAHRERGKRRLLLQRRLKGGGGSYRAGGEDDNVRGAWLNPAFGSFDDFGSAMVLLYICASGDGWEDVMFAGMDAMEDGIAPVRSDSNPVALFFILWMFTGSFFAINLFVGVVVENFNRISKQEDGSATMTTEQL
eukprot:1238227-Prymnesium_polylepis.1